MPKDDFRFLASIYDFFIKPSESSSWKEEILSGGAILDIGGGTARIAIHLLNGDRKIILADLSLPMLRVSKKYDNNQLMRVCCDAHNPPFPGEVFNYIIMVDALHHIRNPQPALHELIEKLHFGGKVIIEEPNIEHWQVKLIAWGERILGMDSHFFPSETIKRWLIKKNLLVETKEDHHNFLIIIKKEEN